jgi:uncharacterized glyoxalase superfamily protein PhnB
MTVAPVPAGYHTVTPWIISRDSAAEIAFIERAFGGVELGRVAGPDGGIAHAEVRIGTSVVMLFDARAGWPEMPTCLRLFVPDVDAVYAQALRAGATVVSEITNLYFGDRVARVRDPMNNFWWIQTHVEDVDPAELPRRAEDPEAARALSYFGSSLEEAMRSLQLRR